MTRIEKRRRGLNLVAVVLIAAAVAGTGAHDVRADDPPTALDGTTFVNGLLAGDPAVCGSMTERFAKLLATLTQESSCAEAMVDIRSSIRESAEEDALSTLGSALDAAELVASENIDRLDYKAAWIGPRFTVKALAAALRGMATEAGPLKVKLGKGPAAARGTPKNLVVIDVARTKPKTLMLYAESKAGTIWQLVAPISGKPRLIRTKVRGVGVPAVPPTAPVTTIASGEPTGSSFVLARIAPGPFLGITFEGSTDILFVREADGRYDQLLLGSALIPPPVAVPGGDPAAFTTALLTALNTGDGVAFCALVHPDLLLLNPATPEDCIKEDPLVAVESTPASLIAPAADGTILRALAIKDPKAPPGEVSLTVYYLAQPGADGYRLIGLFVDLAELIDALPGPEPIL